MEMQTERESRKPEGKYFLTWTDSPLARWCRRILYIALVMTCLSVICLILLDVIVKHNPVLIDESLLRVTESIAWAASLVAVIAKILPYTYGQLKVHYTYVFIYSDHMIIAGELRRNNKPVEGSVVMEYHRVDRWLYDEQHGVICLDGIYAFFAEDVQFKDITEEELRKVIKPDDCPLLLEGDQTEIKSLYNHLKRRMPIKPDLYLVSLGGKK